jgi:hypothetical protein
MSHYSQRDNAVVMHDAILRLVCLIEISDDETIGELKNLLLAMPLADGPAMSALNTLIDRVRSDDYEV